MQHEQSWIQQERSVLMRKNDQENPIQQIKNRLADAAPDSAAAVCRRLDQHYW